MDERFVKGLQRDRVAQIAGSINLRGLLVSCFGDGVVSEQALGSLTEMLPRRSVTARYVEWQATRAFARAEKDRQESRLRKYVVSTRMPEDQLNAIMNDWKGFREFSYKPTGLRPAHGGAAEIRKLELLMLAELSQSSALNRSVKLVGENALAAVDHFSKVVVGITAPNLDVRDLLTRNTKVRPLQLTGLHKHGFVSDRVYEILSRPGFVSRLPCQDDTRKAQLLVGRQLYITKVAAADACNAAQATDFYWTVIIPRDLMTRLRTAEGSSVSISSLGAYYRVFEEKGKKKIAFDFRDFCVGYVHDLQEYVSLSQPSVVHTPHASYFYSIVRRYGDVCLVRLSVVPESVGLGLPRQMEVVTGVETVLIHSWRYVSGQSKYSSQAFAPVTLTVDKDMFNRVANYFLSVNQKEVAVQEGVRLLRALNSGAVVHGQSLNTQERVASQDLFPLAVAAALRALYVRLKGDSQLRRHLKDIEAVRALTQYTLSLPFVAVYEWFKTSWFEFTSIRAVRSLVSKLGLTRIMDMWSRLFFSESRKEVKFEVISTVRWLDEKVPTTLSALVEIPVEEKSKRKYSFEPVVLHYQKVDTDLDDSVQSDSLTIAEQSFVSSVEGKPVELTEADKVTWINQAILEAEMINTQVINDTEGEMKRLLYEVFPYKDLPNKSYIDRTWSGATAKQSQVVCIHVDAGVVNIYPPKMKSIPHMYIVKLGSWKKEDWVEMTSDVQLETLADGYYLTSRALEIFTAYKMSHAFQGRVPVTELNCSAQLVTGIAGGGKTRTLVRKLLSGCLVMASTKRGREELKLAADDHGVTYEERQFRTLDSYLANKPYLLPRQVVQDECYQQHPGFLFVALLQANGNTGKLSVPVLHSGDKVQVRYINRGRHVLGYTDMPEWFYSLTTYLSESFRCPVDAVLANADQYASIGMTEVSSYSKVMRSMSVATFTTIDDVPVLTDAEHHQYITMTHVEQHALVAALRAKGVKVALRADVTRGLVGVNVPGEIQGMSAQTVVLVRMYDTNHIAYGNEGPNLVAITRHTHSFKYVTIVPDSYRDPLLDKIRKAMTASEQSLSRYVATKDMKCHTTGDCVVCSHKD